MSDRPLDQSRCDMAALRFSNMFYKRMDDRNRPNLPSLYAEGAVLTWNGNKLVGRQEVAKFYAQLPPTTSQASSVSAQLLEGDIFPANSVLVTCHGQVKYLRVEDRRFRLFSQAFVLSRQADGSFTILSDTFRTSEP